MVGVFHQNRPAKPVPEEAQVGQVGEEFQRGGERGPAKPRGRLGALIREAAVAGHAARSASSPGVQLAPPVSGVHLSSRGQRGPPSSLNCLGH